MILLNVSQKIISPTFRLVSCFVLLQGNFPVNPTDIYLFKFYKETLEKGVKYFQR